MSTPQEERDSTPHATPAVRRVAVLGAGTMGHGIAQAAAAAGNEVVLRDLEASFVEKGLRAIESNLSKGVRAAR